MANLSPQLQAWFDSCTTLVFYAMETDGSDPGPETPCFVVESPRAMDAWGSDTAPYLSLATREDFVADLSRSRAQAQGASELLSVVDQIEAWFSALASPFILWQLEPPGLAGTGRALSVVNGMIAAEKSQKARARAGSAHEPNQAAPRQVNPFSVKNLSIGCFAHVLMVLGFIATEVSLEEFTSRPSSFCFFLSGAIWIPVFWTWHFFRYRALRIGELALFAKDAPIALLFILPIMWVYILVQLLAWLSR